MTPTGSPVKAPLAAKPQAPPKPKQDTPNSHWRRHLDRMIGQAVTVHYGQEWRQVTGKLLVFDLSSKGVAVEVEIPGLENQVITVGHYNTIEFTPQPK